MLADPVGSGKTYVALAVAASVNRAATTACVVPAALRSQWQATAARLNIEVEVTTHEQASRGRLPRAAPGMVVIDESHHFRHPHTRRYGHLAPWLVGRRALMVTATPVVNRLADLAHQLRLAVRDDALAPDGVPSLRVLLASGSGHPALGRLVVEGSSGPAAAARPRRSCRRSLPTRREEREAARALELVARLRLSRQEAVAGLVRGTLWVAAASSPAALAGALRRYRRLLLQARDAAAAGRRLGRSELRRFSGGTDDQLVWWELVPEADGGPELALDDLDVLDALIAEAARAAEADDQKLVRLRALLADGRRTLVFVARRETARYVRDRLGGAPAAWCTGTRAGIGHTPLPREAVLAWFRADAPEVPGTVGPVHLVATDVAAEGLDLHGVERVVHYDLPWTPMRLEQREGRAVRLGSLHTEVEVVRFTPPRVLERLLGQAQALAGKARLPAAVGLGAAGHGLWRWRGELAERFAIGERTAGTSGVRATTGGVLAGFALRGAPGGAGVELATAVVWLGADGRATEDPAVVAPRLEEAVRAGPGIEPGADQVRRALAALAGPVRSRLELARGWRWAAPVPDAAARRLTARLQAQVRTSARRRDRGALAALERALRFVGGGHTAGEDVLIARLADVPHAVLRRALARLPAPTPAHDAMDVRLLGLVIFAP